MSCAALRARRGRRDDGSRRFAWARRGERRRRAARGPDRAAPRPDPRAPDRGVRASRMRRRAARAAQLMLLGLVYERAHLRLGATPTEGVPRAPPRAASGADFGLPAEADAFVSAILCLPTSSPKDGDPPYAISDRSAGANAPPGNRVRTRRRAEANESVPSAPSPQRQSGWSRRREAPRPRSRRRARAPGS